MRRVEFRTAVIVDAVGPGGAVGRREGGAPGIDGQVHPSHRLPVRVGDIVTATITGADAYDLRGTLT